MSTRSVGDLLAKLTHQGERIAEGESFTIESERARAKLQQFSLDSPDRYVLLAVAALVASQAKTVRLDLGTDELALQADTDWSREPFHGFWSRLLGWHSGSKQTELWLLGLSILTSFGLKNIDWMVESSDASGRWRYALQVRKGELAGEGVESLETISGLEQKGAFGLQVRVVRRGGWRLGRRYFRFLTKRLFSRGCPQEDLLKSRILLPDTTCLWVNGRVFPGTSEPQGLVPGLLAIARRGNGPKLNAPIVVKHSGTPQLVAVFTEPGSVGDRLMEETLGPSGSISWIWNGLRMGSSLHGLRYGFARVAVWSDQLQPDLSFRSVVETRQRKQLERIAKDSIRELFRGVAESLAQSVDPSVPFPLELVPVRSTLISALRYRIQLSRARNRLGPVNRSLIEVPLFWGFDGGDQGKLYRFRELWEEAEKGHPIALLVTDSNDPEIRPWPGRPLVLHLSKEGAELFRHLIPNHLLEDGHRLKRRLESFHTGESSQQFRLPPNPDLEGRCTASWGSAQWWLVSVSEAHESRVGQLYLRVGTAAWSIDSSLTLPPGLVVKVPEPPAVDHRGRLVGEEVRAELTYRVVEGVGLALGEAWVAELRPALFDEVVPHLLALRFSPEFQERDWTVFDSLPIVSVSFVDGRTERLSLEEVARRYRELDSPLYRLVEGSPPLEPPYPKVWGETPLLDLPSELLTELGARWKMTVSSEAGFRQLRERLRSQPFCSRRVRAEQLEPPWTLPVELLGGSWGGPLEVEVYLPWGALQVHAGGLYGYLGELPLEPVLLGSRIDSLAVMVRWGQGWPNWDGSSTVPAPELDGIWADLDRLLPPLLADLLETVEVERLSDLSEEFLEVLFFELLSEEAYFSRRLLLRADGSKLSLRELREMAEHRIESLVTFRDLNAFRAAPPEALFWPAGLEGLASELLPGVVLLQ